MPHHFLSDNLVKLPRFSVPDLIALMSQLETEAGQALKAWSDKGHQVPDFVAKAVAYLTQTRQSLENAQSQPLSPEVIAQQRHCDRKMDDAWRAFESFCKAWTLLDDGLHPGQSEAQRVYDLVIGDGVGFITLPFELEWQETKKRIEIVERQNLIGIIDALGGRRFWIQLKKVFAEYGEVLQMTEPRPGGPALRTLWESAYNAVRHYFTKVVALEDPEEPETQTLVRHLLKPILEWQQRAVHSATSTRAISIPKIQVVGKDANEPESTAFAKTLKMRIVEEKKR